MSNGEITFRHDRRPGDDALIVDMHRLGYAGEGDRFGPSFWAFVGETVAEAELDTPSRSRIWFAERGDETLGCAAMVDRGDRGQLRWVVLRVEGRGTGAGRTLVDLAMDHARACGFRSVFLETTDGLDASMGIYERLGFRTVSAKLDELWHGNGIHIVMELDLA